VRLRATASCAGSPAVSSGVASSVSSRRSAAVTGARSNDARRRRLGRIARLAAVRDPADEVAGPLADRGGRVGRDERGDDERDQQQHPDELRRRLPPLPSDPPHGSRWCCAPARLS